MNAANDIRQRLFLQVTETVDSERWGQFHVRIISGEERQEYVEFVRTDPKEVELYAFLTSLALSNPEGARVFKPEELAEAKKIPSPLLLAIFNAASALNFPKIEDVKKNSGTTKTSTSSSR